MIWGAAAGFVLSPGIAWAAQRLEHQPKLLSWRGRIALLIGCAIAGAAAVSARPTAAVPIYVVLLSMVTAAAVVDAAEQRLPDVLTLGSIAFGLIAFSVITWTTGEGSIWRALVGGAIFGGWIFVGALIVHDGYGLGDIKLAAALGILLGWDSWLALAIGILATQLAVAVALLVAILNRKPRASLGPAFGGGAVVALALLALS